MQRGTGRLALEGTDEPVNERPSVATDVQHRMRIYPSKSFNRCKNNRSKSPVFLGNGRDMGAPVLLSCRVWLLNLNDLDLICMSNHYTLHTIHSRHYMFLYSFQAISYSNAAVTHPRLFAQSGR